MGPPRVENPSAVPQYYPRVGTGARGGLALKVARELDRGGMVHQPVPPSLMPWTRPTSVLATISQAEPSHAHQDQRGEGRRRHGRRPQDQGKHQVPMNTKVAVSTALRSNCMLPPAAPLLRLDQ